MSKDEKVSDVFANEHESEEHHTPGTMVLSMLLLSCFAVYYFANWKALSDVWWVR